MNHSEGNVPVGCAAGVSTGKMMMCELACSTILIGLLAGVIITIQFVMRTAPWLGQILALPFVAASLGGTFVLHGVLCSLSRHSVELLRATRANRGRENGSTAESRPGVVPDRSRVHPDHRWNILPGLLVPLILWISPAAAQPLFFPSTCPEIIWFGPCPPRPAPAANSQAPAASTPAPALEPQKPVQQESVFAEPQVGPDGKLRIYLPPKPVVNFLEQPTPENAQAYLQWNKTRIEKALAAQSVLDQVSGVQSGLSASPSPGRSPGVVQVSQPTTPPPAAAQASFALPLPSRPPTTQTAPLPPGPLGGTAGATEVLYLLATWCPYCAKETPIMAEFARKHPGIRVSGIAFDSKPETIPPYAQGLPFSIRQGTDDEKAAWGIRAYPTIVIVKDGVPVGRITGLTSLETLEQASGVGRSAGR